MHSVSDLTTFSRPTTGDVPPKLVGASTTVVGSKVYLYGGRLVTERRMVTDMWLFDLNTLVWRKLEQFAEVDMPASRYFHSADAWDHYLVVFGGMGINPEAEDTSDELLVLSDVRFFDLNSNRWMPSTWSTNDLHEPPIAPKPRYAHLSSVSGSKLFIIGGQDLNNVWLDDVYVYDLHRRGWVSARDYPRHCGTYRSVAISGNLRVRLPLHEQREAKPTPKPVFRPDGTSSMAMPQTSSDSLIHLPYSAPPTEEFPTDIYLYSNYNFTDVKRELEVFSPRPGNNFEITDHSSSMVGTSFPPGLRFPSGAILGHHLIIAGTYLAHSFQSSSVWALNLHDMTWSRIDPGSTLSTGSWFRTALWADANKFVIFGNRAGNLVDDYNRRLLSWDDVALIDLEAFGIYQPPKLELNLRMQEIGLAALEEGVLADFEVVCDDDRRIRCSRKLLDERWPWFREQRKLFIAAASRALDAIPMSAQDGPAPELPGGPRPDPRLSPRKLALSEPYPVTLALLQYFYSMALLTPLQHAPPVLSALLVIATNYGITHLQSLVKHAMHRALSNSTSVGVYEVATLCSCRSLQIRALKTVMLYNQKRPVARSRQDKEGGGSSRAPEGNQGGGAGGAGLGPESASNARPRGMSDAQWMTNRSGGGAPGGRAVAADVADADDLPLVPTLSEALATYELLGSPSHPPEQLLPTAQLPATPTKQPLFLHRKAKANLPPLSTSVGYMLPNLPEHAPALVHARPRSDSSMVLSSSEHMRRTSVVSLSTHDDLTVLGDLLAPVVEIPLDSDEDYIWDEATEAQASVATAQTNISLDTSARSSLHLSDHSHSSHSTDGRGDIMPQFNVEMIPPLSPTTRQRTSTSSSSVYSSPFSQEDSFLSPTSASSITSRTSSYYHGRARERDSDTPSLTSSASRSSLGESHRSSSVISPPVSPGPGAHFSVYDAAEGLSYLSTISEPEEEDLRSSDAHFRRQLRSLPLPPSHIPVTPPHPYSARNYGHNDGKWGKGDGPLTFADPSTATILPNKPSIEDVRISSSSPTNTIVAPPELNMPSSPRTAVFSGSSIASSSSSSHGKKGLGGFARMMSPSRVSLSPSTSELSSPPAHKAAFKSPDTKMAKEFAKQAKAEAQRLKKEEDRLRKERLMLEFRAKADAEKRKKDAASTYSDKSEGRKRDKAAWEEKGAMYSGLNTFL